MGGCCIVLRAEPLIEPVVSWLRLLRRVELAVAVPLSDMSRVVAGSLEQVRDRRFLASEMHEVVVGNVVVDSGPIRGAPGEKAGPRG